MRKTDGKLNDCLAHISVLYFLRLNLSESIPWIFYTLIAHRKKNEDLRQKHRWILRLGDAGDSQARTGAGHWKHPAGFRKQTVSLRIFCLFLVGFLWVSLVKYPSFAFLAIFRPWALLKGRLKILFSFFVRLLKQIQVQHFFLSFFFF